MSYEPSASSQRSPAPCIVDLGTVINKQDMQRLLIDLGRVHYSYTQDGVLSSEAEGYILEVFADPYRSTLVANHALYLNVHSFDYLELDKDAEQKPVFNLVQEGRVLRLLPLTNPLQEDYTRTLDEATLEAVVAEVLSAGLDVQIDDEEPFPF
jgi:hypothetical protein